MSDMISIVPSPQNWLDSRKYGYLLQSQWWSPDRIYDYQLFEMQRLLFHAYQNTPYYRTVLRQIGFAPEDMRTLKDLERLPILTRELLRKHREEMVATDRPKDHLTLVKTGGTTGEPLAVYRDRDTSNAEEAAFVWALWSRLGIYPGDKVAVFTGNSIKGKYQGSLWKYNKDTNSLWFSCAEASADEWAECLEKLREFNPSLIRRYPSILNMIASYMMENGVEPIPNVKAIGFGSENLYPFQRTAIETAFQMRLFGLYGQSERTVMAGWCEHSDVYHIIPEYGYVELLDGNDQPITEPGRIGEIVATGINNYAMPLIRYRTGDMGQYARGPCKCGRSHPLIASIDGREREFILKVTGEPVLLGPRLYGRIWDRWDMIDQIQFEQSEPGYLLARIIPNHRASRNDILDLVRRSFQVNLTDLDLHVEFVDHIPRTNSGKHRFLIQHLAL